MNRILNIEGHLVKVRFNALGMVHLEANYALRELLRNRLRNVEEVYHRVLREYKMLFGKDLDIRMNSFVLEILAHVYVYELMLFFRKFLPMGIFRKLSFHACTIDCGKKKLDTNRWFWDTFRFLTPVLFLFAKR